MSPPILGVTGYYLEPAAAVLVEGRLAAAWKEETLAGRPVAPGFPLLAVQRCLADAALSVTDLGYVGFADRPLSRFQRVVTHSAAGGLKSFRQAMIPWLQSRLHVAAHLRRDLGTGCRAAVLFTDYHEALAAAAFFASPFEAAAVITLDGLGARSTGALGQGRGARLELSHMLPGPHSLSLFLQAVANVTTTAPLGRDVHRQAEQGQPRFRDLLLEAVLDLRPDGSFRLRSEALDFSSGVPKWRPKLQGLLSGTGEQHQCDLIASAWAVCREVTGRAARHALQQTGQRRLAVGGEWTPHWLDHDALRSSGQVDEIWSPSGAAASAAAGAAWLLHHHVLAAPRSLASVVAAS